MDESYMGRYLELGEGRLRPNVLGRVLLGLLVAAAARYAGATAHAGIAGGRVGGNSGLRCSAAAPEFNGDPDKGGLPLLRRSELSAAAAVAMYGGLPG